MILIHPDNFPVLAASLGLPDDLDYTRDQVYVIDGFDTVQVDRLAPKTNANGEPAMFGIEVPPLCTVGARYNPVTGFPILAHREEGPVT